MSYFIFDNGTTYHFVIISIAFSYSICSQSIQITGSWVAHSIRSGDALLTSISLNSIQCASAYFSSGHFRKRQRIHVGPDINVIILWIFSYKFRIVYLILCEEGATIPFWLFSNVISWNRSKITHHTSPSLAGHSVIYFSIRT